MPLWMQIADSSMEPRLRSGDIVYTDHVTPRPGDLVLARVNRRPRVRQLRVQSGRRGRRGRQNFALVPLNRSWPVVHSRSTPICILGRVTAIQLNFLPLSPPLRPGKVYRVTAD